MIIFILSIFFSFLEQNKDGREVRESGRGRYGKVNHNVYGQAQKYHGIYFDNKEE